MIRLDGVIDSGEDEGAEMYQGQMRFVACRVLNAMGVNEDVMNCYLLGQSADAARSTNSVNVITDKLNLKGL